MRQIPYLNSNPWVAAINMLVDGQRVSLEIQVKNEGDFPERILHQWARIYSNSIESGGDYIKLPRTVIISIIDFPLLDCKEFHSEFRPLEVTRHEELTNKMTLHFFELKKLPDDISDKNGLKLWLALFKANTQEELDKIKATEVKVMEQAINAYNKVTVSPEFKELERLRSIARHNEASALRFEREQIAKNLLNVDVPVEKIITATGLTREEVENLSITH